MKTRLTDELLHARVAQIHGWELSPCTCGLSHCKKELRWHAVKGDGRMVDVDDFVFYPTNLEAVREVERSLNSEDHHQFVRFLYKVVIGKPPKTDLWLSTSVGLLLKATAKEHCIALVECFSYLWDLPR